MFSNEYIEYLINRGNDEQNQIFETKSKLLSDFYIIKKIKLKRFKQR